MKRNENFWSYRLHKLGTPKVMGTDGQTEGQSEPTTRPAFTKAKQVINKLFMQQPFFCLYYDIQYPPKQLKGSMQNSSKFKGPLRKQTTWFILSTCKTQGP